MADFFSKLKKGIDKGTAIVGAKSNTLIETNKLKTEIGTANRIKKETLLEVGTAVYEQSIKGGFSIESVEELITRISEADAKVADLNAKIVKIQEEEKEKMADINAMDTPAEKVVEAEAIIDDAIVDVKEVVQEEVSEVLEEVEEIKQDDNY